MNYRGKGGEGLLAPQVLGLPEKFKAWRRGQEHIIRTLVDDMEDRFVMSVAPTGAGKSLTYVTAAWIMGARTLILTSTKGLQNQLISDFGGMIADVRGKMAYRCKFDDQWTVEDGPCNFGMSCRLRDSGCHYYDAIKAARNAQIVSTNYAFWMHNAQQREEDTIGRFDMLVLDEVHDAPDWVCQFLGVKITAREIKDARLASGETIPAKGGVVQDWIRWAGQIRNPLETKLGTISTQVNVIRDQKIIREAQRLKAIERKLNAILRAHPDWVASYGEDWAGLEPVWADVYAEPILFRGTPRVFMTSATAGYKTAGLMGVEREKVLILEQPSSFPVENRPVIYVESPRVDHRMGMEDERDWLRKIDQVVSNRKDRKGIIHTVSYARRDAIMEFIGARIPEVHWVTHGSLNAGYKVNEFRMCMPPAVLVSPAMATGWDFPEDECRYQIIAKVPFPDARSEVMKARTRSDREYAYYVAMQGIVQACGRAVRSESDWAETFILDGHWEWFWGRYKGFAPKWFQEAVYFRRTIPAPPEIQEEEGGEG